MVRIRQSAGRQRWRMALLLLSFLLFPITLFYFSPYIIVVSASEGIVNASLIAFGLMFVAALFVGRLWCGWACPGAGLQELAIPIRNRLFGPKWLDWIKWAIWIPWISLIVWLAVRAGGYRQVNIFHHLDGGLTVEQSLWYLVYYAVIVAFLAPALLFGRRAGCHTICWMAPFMILGRKLRNLAAWPSLRLVARSSACKECLKCTSNCPMSLDVHDMVQREQMEHRECILCGTCVDSCSQDAIRFSFSAGK